MAQRLGEKIRRGRPSLYRCVLEALDPVSDFSPASLANFADSYGFLQLLFPNEVDDPEKVRDRMRIAMGRWRKLKSFPPDGDGTLVFRGRGYLAWKGWRWQECESVHAALFALRKKYQPYWQMIDGNASYSLLDLVECFDALPIPRPPVPSFYDRYTKAASLWQQVCRKQVLVMLSRHAQLLGLDPAVPYSGNTWRGSGGELATPLESIRPVFAMLNQNGIFTPASIVEAALECGVLKDNSHAYLVRLRASLYRLAIAHRFPVEGDVLIQEEGQAPIPGWAGARWKIALGLPY